MICFYHRSDLDGICSAAIVLKQYPGAKPIGVDYKDSLDQFKHLIPKNEVVYVVDFSFRTQEMIWLNENGHLHWIDHHKTSVEWANTHGFLASGGQSLHTSDNPKLALAGCEQTWTYLFDTLPPKAVYYLGRYDVWDHSNDDNILKFQYGMRNISIDVRHPYWGELLSEKPAGVIIQKRLEEGGAIIRYEDSQNAIIAKGMCFETQIEGIPAIAINKPFTNSKVFDSVFDPEKHELMIAFAVKPDEVKYTLYSTDEATDCSAIAKAYGGGGHKSAAGFYTKHLILEAMNET